MTEKQPEQQADAAARVQAEHPKNNFDFWRVLAALMVLFSHQFALLGMPEPQIVPSVSPGGLGVCIFFAISGFLVTQSWDRDPNALRFVKRRFLRIWPGLIAVTVLGAFVLGPLVTNLSVSDYFRAGETAHYFKTLLLNIKYYLPGVFINNPYPRAVNGSLWTIPVEVHWYVVILVAGVVGLLRFRHFVFAALVVLAIYYLGIYGAESNPKRIYFQEFGLFFLYGACLHLYQEQWRKHVALTALFLICSALIALFFGHPLVALWLVLPFLVIVFGTASTPVIRRFGRFGDLSYGIYIYAFPVQQTVAWLTSARYSLTATLGLSAAITTLFAFASWHLIERPALSFKPRQSGR